MVKDGQYITIQGWMVTRLHLNIAETATYAIVYGYSQDRIGACELSVDYLAEWLGSSVDTARRTLHGLVERGLLTAEAQDGKPTLYRCTPFDRLDPSQIASPRKLQGVRASVMPANITIDSDNIKEEGEVLTSADTQAHESTCKEAVPSPSSSFQDWWDLYSGKQYMDEYVTCERIWDTYTSEERAAVMNHTEWFAMVNATKPSKKHPKWYLIDKIWKGEKPLKEIPVLTGDQAERAAKKGESIWQCELPGGKFGFVKEADADKFKLTKKWKF